MGGIEPEHRPKPLFSYKHLSFTENRSVGTGNGNCGVGQG